MRTIKFRYWCTFEKKMYDKAYVEEHMNLAMMSELIVAAQERYVFQQSTGLTDKNGVEIYEGDVVGLSPSERGEVDFYNGMWRVKTTPKYAEDTWRTALWDAVIDEFVVIGNIYENPEMIKEAADE